MVRREPPAKSRPAAPTHRTTLLLVLPLLLACCSPGAAIRSPACPNGCIIAVTTGPDRTCACVEERCDTNTAAASAAADAAKRAAQGRADLATQAAGAGQTAAAEALRTPIASLSPARLFGGQRSSSARRRADGDCGFCDRDFNTYKSIEECEAAGEKVKAARQARGTNRVAYPALAEDQAELVTSQLATLRAAAGAAQPRIAANDTAGGESVVSVAVSVAAACPWPITPPTDDGVTRTNCPVSMRVWWLRQPLD